jgi:hypothetical protein
MHGTTTFPLDDLTQQSLARLEALARLMDGVFVLPGTTIRFGLGGIIGLVPVAGDMIAGLVSAYLIWEARQLGAPSWLIARMLAKRSSIRRSAPFPWWGTRSTCSSAPT